jgi:hypothetical protein
MLSFVRLVVGVLSLLLCIVGCGAEHKPTPFLGTTCGIPYTFKTDGKTVLSGTCAALLPPTPPQLTVRLGERFSVQIAHEQDGRLDFPVPVPITDAVRMLGRSGATATYTAQSLGTVTLIARHTESCLKTNPHIGTCPALDVRVVAH